MHKGSCLCGGVTFTVDGPLRAVTSCHCSQCRKTSGHYWAATSAQHTDFTLTAMDTLTWFSASDTAKRGFCGRCGSTLFWQPQGEARISISAGAIDGATGLKTTKHIYCADKGDYYDLPADVPSFEVR